MDDNAMPAFHRESAGSYIGKYILVGVTYLDGDGRLIRHDQRHGVIVDVKSSQLSIALKGNFDGEMFSIPLDLRAIKEANPGSYELLATEEIVIDPDLISTWTVTKSS
jgi:hypothetical protein